MALAAVVVTLPLGACGVKSVPHAPEGATHPRQYPVPEGRKGKTAQGEPEAERKDGPPGPLGFPMEYPNRR